MADVPDIKLIRTDTTLDLSHSAEKRCGCIALTRASIISVSLLVVSLSSSFFDLSSFLMS